MPANLSDSQLHLFCGALKAVNAGIIVLDEQERIVFWNEWMERYSFVAEEQTLDKTLPELYPEMQSARLLHAIRNALSNRMPSILSQTLNKSPLPLYATQQDFQDANRMQQAIQVIPIAAIPTASYCMIQVTDVSAAVNRESILRQQALELRSKAHIDGLTGIANRRRFDEQGEETFRSARRNNKPMSLIMIDIDFFKSYNDNYGHQRGDECLIEVAKALSKEICRPFDLVARYGGEEFVVVLPDTNAEGALHLANRMRSGVEGMLIEHATSKVNVVTISMGVSTFDPFLHVFNFAELIRQADEALYKAKEAGRNRIVQYSLADAKNA